MAYTLAIDLGGTNTKFALVNRELEICHERSYPTFAELGAEQACQRWLSQIKDWLVRHPIDLIGIGSPGPLDSDRGMILSTPNLKDWAHFSFTEFFEKALKVPTFIENDANCAALGEWSQEKHIDDHVVLTIGTGVGSGVISNGQLLRGANGWAVEAGHMTIDMRGPLCACGKRGCLEAIVGGHGLVARYLERATEKIRDLSPHEVFNRAKLGESLALTLAHEWAEGLAVGVGNLLNIFNPTRVTLTGGVSQNFTFVEERFRKKLLTEAFALNVKYCEIVVSKLQNKAGLLGAAIWAHQNYERQKMSPVQQGSDRAHSY